MRNTMRVTSGCPSAQELDQGTITSELDHSATMSSERRLKAFSPMGLQAGKGAAFVPTHQAGIADHIGCKDCR